MEEEQEDKKGEPVPFSDEHVYKVTQKAVEDTKIVGTEGLRVIADVFFTQGLTVQDALNLQPEQVEGVYGQAYRLFNNGQYEQAENIFKVLCMIDTQEPKYPLGIAACLHMQKEYLRAVALYFLVSELDPDNPIPYYHIADCYLQLEKYNLAKKALRGAIERCGDKPEYAVIKDRSKMTLESLKNTGEEKEPDQPKKKKK